MSMFHMWLLGFASLVVFTLVGWVGVGLQKTHTPIVSSSFDQGHKVIFQAAVMDELPITFEPVDGSQFLQIGEERRNVYILENKSDEVIYIRPIHSVAPADAAAHYVMTVCFCFNDQRIEPGARMEFPLVYQFTDGMDARTNPIHINYNIHRIDPNEMRPVKGEGGL
jgi:cytochrome c oxidase assembly protein Cox11